MAKSYVPQLAKMLQRVGVYIAKHEATMRNYTLTSAQSTDITTLKQIATDFSSVQWRETP